MSGPTLSVVTCCSGAISKEFYLKELIESVWDIATEIIVINGDNKNDPVYSETCNVLYNNFSDYKGFLTEGAHTLKNKIKIYHNPWQKRMGCMMGRLQRSLAISHATKDYIMLLDADEIIHEKDHDKIRKCLELGYTAYAWHTIHFYRDYNTIKIPGGSWYDYRANLFKNNSYTFDMHDSNNGYQGTVYANMEDSERDRKYLPLSGHPGCKKTSIEVFHYGHVRSEKVYLQKTNEINASYHPHYKDLKTLMWDMSNTRQINITHPEVLHERIKNHKEKYPEYYESNT